MSPSPSPDPAMPESPLSRRTFGRNVLGTAATMLLGVGLPGKSWAQQEAAPTAESQIFESSGKVYSCRPGPWGELFYYYVYLEAPKELVDRFPMPNSVTSWRFPGKTVEDLRKLFTKAGLSATLQDYLLSDNRINHTTEVLTVFPPLPDLEALTPQQRAIIYTELGKYEINEYYFSPVLITSGNIGDWARGSNLRPAIVEAVEKLTYFRGKVLCFSDPAAVLNHVVDDAEAQAFFKALTRTRTMIVRLKVDDNVDVAAVTSYWTGRNRYKDIMPILNSVVETEDVTTMDVVHLLPSMARRYLYTYPALELAFQGRLPDCHWTSLNFFNHWAKQYFLDTRLAANALLTNYERVLPPYEFGDVLMFMQGDTGGAFHSCVYIADDIVFTKNGENLVSPWVLMKIEDVRHVYFHSVIGKIVGYRLKS